MKVLILGSTGMLGRTLMNEGKLRVYNVIGAAKDSDEYSFDILDDSCLVDMVNMVNPDVIINTIAIIDHEICEKNPGLAYAVNTRPLSILANVCCKKKIYLVHISTDHYFTDGASKKHKETEPVTLVSEYARTKYLAEILVRTYENSLIIRTNIVGFRYERDKPTFVEWVLNCFSKDTEMTLFSDYYTSSIDVRNFSKILFDLIEKKTIGILNVASQDVSSKKEFIEALAQKLNHNLSHAKNGTVLGLSGAKRATSLGLDVSCAEKIVGYSFPSKEMVIESLVSEYREHGNEL